ncbi:MAG: PadR family transcriptional regulator [Alphaproteobacteria bacterium]
MAIDVRTICLGLLSRGPATGYEIKKSFEEGPIGYFLEASFGAIYPALGRLTEEGLVDLKVEQQDGKPDRKVYSLTARGRTAFEESLRVDPGPDRFRSEFLFLLLFADHIPPGHLRHLIDERLKDYRCKLTALENCPPQASGGLEFMRGHGITVYRAIIEYIENNRHVLEASAERVPAHAAE